MLLFAFAGFRVVTVPPREVAAMDARVTAYLQAGEKSLQRQLDTLIEESGTSAPGSSASESSREYETDKVPAMNMEAFGVTREAGKLRAIEDSRREQNDAGREALGDE